MKAITFIKKNKLIIGNIKKPAIGDHEALIKVRYGGICGTDMMIYAGVHPRAQPSLVLGHEFSGVIDKIKEGHHFTSGDKVAINPLLHCNNCESCRLGNYHICENLRYIGIDLNGGFAEYVKVPLTNIHKLDQAVKEDDAALIEPLAVAIHTVRRSRFKIGDVITIIGAGPIGILIGIVAKQAGASEVVISDISNYRLEVAKSYGLTVINSSKSDLTEEVKNITNGNGADVVFEVAGNQATANQMISVIKTQGEIMVVSVYKSQPTIDLAKMHFRELSLSTTRCYEPKDFETAINFIEENRIDLSSLVSHRIPIESFQQGFDLVENAENSLKVLFKF